MCFKDMLAALRVAGVNPTPAQVRYAIYNGKISTPEMDGSLSFNFDPQQIEELLAYFRGRKARRQSPVLVA